MLLKQGNAIAGVLGNIIAASEQHRSVNPGDFRDGDGFLCCGVCGERKETFVPFAGKRLPSLCRCGRELEIAQDELARKKRVVARKRRCFSHERLWQHTFESDNGKQPKMELGKKYVREWERVREQNIGLILLGDVGTGKSYCAAAIANELCERDIPVRFVNLAEVLNDLQAAQDRNAYIRDMTRASLLIIDDFGIQRQTEYAQEQVFNLVDNRIRSGKPMIVTTNLSLDELKNPSDMAQKRIYDRLLEVCVPVLFAGDSMRKDERNARRQELMELFSGA